MRPLFLSILLWFFHPAWCESRREREEKIINRILSPERYDPSLRPPGVNDSDGPTLVRVTMLLHSISAIDDQKMQYNVQLTLRQRWLDERLRYNDQNDRLKPLTLTNAKHIWEPDLFFADENEGHFHDIIVPNFYYRIYSDGSVLYSRRLSLTLGCPMNLTRYPFDRQICTLRIASYSYNQDDLITLWEQTDAVEVVRNLQMPVFSLEKFDSNLCHTITQTGTFTCLRVDFFFKRLFFVYLTQIYIPTAMIVLVSFASFWFDPWAVQARTFLGLSTLFSLGVLTSIVNAAIPQVSYTKSIDIWTGGCLTLVFAAFLEFATVNYINRSKRKHNTKKREEETVPNSEEFNMNLITDQQGEASNGLRCGQICFKKYCKSSESIDRLARIVFPVIFLLFILSYYQTYAAIPDDN